MVKWYSLFSHTGSETLNLHKSPRVNRLVELQTAITNNMDYDGELPCVKLATAKEINEWLMTPGNVEPGSLVTLNGYMRILPADVIDYLHSINCKLYNIHPAPIGFYPELKGKDPQERLYQGIQNGWYKYIGVVIHDVDAGVDTGNIRMQYMSNAHTEETKDQLYERLHKMGTELWEDFMQRGAEYVWTE